MGVNIMLQKSTDSYVQNKLSRTSTTILYRYHSIYKLHLKCIYHLPSWTFLVEVVLDGGRGGVDPGKGAKTDRQSNVLILVLTMRFLSNQASVI